MTADCRVRRLHIRAHDPAVTPSLTALIEDALRTASFPGVPPNGVVFVRRLDLGPIPRSASSRVISRKIDALFRHVRPVPITENDPEKPFAPAVWFADDLTPHRTLVQLLCRNHRPRSWYWPASVKNWSPALSTRESHRLILSAAAERTEGLRGLAFVTEPLFTAEKFHNVLNTFTTRDMIRLFQVLGLPPAIETVEEPAPAYPPGGISPTFENAVIHALELWHPTDPRTRLVSALALTKMGVAVAAHSHNRLLATVLSSRRPTPAKKPPSRAVTGDPVRMANDGSGGHKPGSQGLNDTDSPVKQPAIVNVTEGFPPDSLSTIPRSDRDAGIRFMTPEDPVQASRSSNGICPVPDEAALPEGSPPSVPDPETVSTPKRESKPRRRHSTRNDRAPFAETGLSDIHWAGEPTGFAGMVFLVPLLKRLGMDTLMGTHPELADRHLPGRILRRCAERFGIPDDDPALAFLDSSSGDPGPSPSFVAPPEWRRILSPSDGSALTVARIHGIRGRRMILDETERLVIGIWAPDNRHQFTPFFPPDPKSFRIAPAREWSVNRLEDTFLRAMNRYVRRYASMGLFGLIRRRGRIALTRTHLDMTLPFRDTDIRVRMAGLDIDPGWVAWMGRVIRFHYIGGEP